LGLGSVLGYVIAGAAIGPWGLRLIEDVESILHKLVCLGKLSLADAQQRIATDWTTAVP